jgi:hypothetical protein
LHSTPNLVTIMRMTLSINKENLNNQWFPTLSNLRLNMKAGSIIRGEQQIIHRYPVRLLVAITILWYNNRHLLEVDLVIIKLRKNNDKW